MLVSLTRRCRFSLLLLIVSCSVVWNGSDAGRGQQVGLFSTVASAQDKFPSLFGGPVTFGETSQAVDAEINVSATLQRIDDQTVEVQVTAQLPAGFYIYSMNESFSGKSSIRLLDTAGLKPVGSEWKADRAPKVVDDKDLGQTVEKFFDQVTWSRRLQSGSRIADDVRLTGELSGQYCSSGKDGTGVCKPLLPPRKFEATLAKAGAAADPTGAPASTGSGSAVRTTGKSKSATAQSAAPAGTSSDTASQDSTRSANTSSAKTNSGNAASGGSGQAKSAGKSAASESADARDAAVPDPHQSPVTIVPMVGYGSARKPAPVRFTLALSPQDPQPGDEVTLSIQADIERPWHIFALDQNPDMAGEPTTLNLLDWPGLQVVDAGFKPSRPPQDERPLPNIVQRVHYDKVVWSRKFHSTGGAPAVSGNILFQLCNDGSCLPPSELEFTVTTSASGGGTRSGDNAVPAGDGTDGTPDSSSELTGQQDGQGHALADQGLMAFLVTAFGAGLIALLTPCVFPMIPVTVAFFLKQSEKDHRSPVGLAVVYCLGIIGTFTILGLVVAVAFGPTKLNELANNRWLNLFFATLFLMFALMLMGMFELRLPSWLLTWSSKRESTGGVVGALFMALTFTLVSFTCTFAFVGTLLVVAARGDFFWPIVGMLAFSSAFASPFFLLALFPSMLKKLPRSGGWMNTVKVTMGLVELALVLKFLSVADIGFSPDRLPLLLDSTSFLVGWVVIAGVTGAYLLNVFRMSHDSPLQGISAVRCLFGILFLSLSAYIGVGIFATTPPSGWLWQQIAAFAPPGKPHHLLDFRVGVRQASAENRLLFLDFTGVNCVNCRRMENTVLADPSIQQALQEMVQVQLFTDEIPGVKNRVLRDELLNLNRTLQAEWFGDVTLPGYAVVTPDGKNVITMFKGLDGTGGEDFLRFINAGVSRWEEYVASQALAEHPGPAQSTVVRLQ